MTTRRSFLTTAGSALVGVVAAPKLLAVPRFARRAEHDLIIRGGTVFDGTGAAGRELDVAISGGRIAAIAPTIAERGKEELDARGLAVSPGFIDIHSHGDGNLDDDPRDESVIRQGVTTIVVGRAPPARRRSRSRRTSPRSMRCTRRPTSRAWWGSARSAVS